MESQQPRKNQPPRQVETTYTVDPLSDLVSATELRVWRGNPTTAKILRYLKRWREQVKEYMGEGGTIAATSDATAVQTVEASSKVQILGEIVTLEAKDIAEFYNLDEPKDEEKK